jgi:hypothetical protein
MRIPFIALLYQQLSASNSVRYSDFAFAVLRRVRHGSAEDDHCVISQHLLIAL